MQDRQWASNGPFIWDANAQAFFRFGYFLVELFTGEYNSNWHSSSTIYIYIYTFPFLVHLFFFNQWQNITNKSPKTKKNSVSVCLIFFSSERYNDNSVVAKFYTLYWNWSGGGFFQQFLHNFCFIRLVCKCNTISINFFSPYIFL